MNKKENIIGIIGGAGVSATNKLLTILEEKYTNNGAFRDSHHPQMIIYQATKAPSRSLFLENRGESFIPDYVNVAKRLESIGASVLCMSCNTAHYAIDEIQNSINIPIINLIEEVVLTCKKYNKPNIGLIASDGCLKGRVYEKYFFNSFSNANIIYPDKETQKLVTKGICNIKNKSRFLPLDDQERPRNLFAKVCDSLRRQGASLIISGCTDIAVDFLPEYYPALPIVDSLSVLADTIYKLTNKDNFS